MTGLVMPLFFQSEKGMVDGIYLRCYNKNQGLADMIRAKTLRKRGKGMTLDLGVAGRSYVVDALELPPRVAKRLEALGMIRGTDVEILQVKPHGAMIVRVRGTRFALGKRISSHIHISGE